jgi:hypothetical protein
MTWKSITPPFQLVNGAHYAASLQLTWLERAAATTALVRSKFEEAGFTEVTVDLINMQVEGVWNGQTETVELPSEVSAVWMWQP